MLRRSLLGTALAVLALRSRPGHTAFAWRPYSAKALAADKEFLTAHRIVQQSTLLMVQGDREVARVIAETDPARLRAFVADHATT